MTAEQPKSNKSNNKYIVLVIAGIIIAIGLAIGNIMEDVGEEKQVKEFQEQIKSLQNTTAQLNQTNTNIINYINQRNEPFIQNVIKYVNETNQRIEALENK